MARVRSIAAAGWVILAGCAAQPRLFDGMGSHTRATSTRSEQAQRYFDQGLIWTYGFNHDEAIRSFREAARLDPEFALAWWGVALCNGPHINFPMVPPERARAAYEAAQKAAALRAHAAPVEQALIDALRKRYDGSATSEPGPLDRAYADAMARVWAEFPEDPDVGTLYAEALMDLRPWDLWDKDGAPRPGTATIVATLQRVLQLDPMHPGANHLLIHALEASRNPELADQAADRLRRLVPASGHLTHMPSHIDVLAGRWALAIEQNELAIDANRRYRTLSPRQGFYRVYMLHDDHMLSFAAMMSGRRREALAAARRAVAGVPAEFRRSNAALVDPYLGVVYDVHKRFGAWDDMLLEPPPPDGLPITAAMWRFNRALALAARAEIAAAERERDAFATAVDRVPRDAMMAINPARRILEIAGRMADAEIALARGDHERAVAELRKAVELEDDLRYMEPPEWVQPVRHTLGAVLAATGMHSQAEDVYRADLARWPENVWSLYGLRQCLLARGADAEAEAVAARFRKAAEHADTPIATSCLCVPSLAPAVN